MSQVFLPAGWSSFLHVQCPLADDTEQHSFRVKLHKLFNLPLVVPCLRSAQAVTFAPSKLLRSPHIHINKPRGVVSVVKGDYHYHHYMQDGMDDAGWGCAYRSLQSIWSWFILNGFTDKPVPSHAEIQRCLVEIGDKERSCEGVAHTILGVDFDEITRNDKSY
ncbi:peptidase family C78 [Ostertagia ostertagi]